MYDVIYNTFKKHAWKFSKMITKIKSKRIKATKMIQKAKKIVAANPLATTTFCIIWGQFSVVNRTNIVSIASKNVS